MKWNLFWWRKKPTGKPEAKPKPEPARPPQRVEFISTFSVGYSQTYDHCGLMGLEQDITYADAEKKYAEAFHKRVAEVKRELRTKKWVEASNGMVRSAAVRNLNCRMQCHRRGDE